MVRDIVIDNSKVLLIFSLNGRLHPFQVKTSPHNDQIYCFEEEEKCEFVASDVKEVVDTNFENGSGVGDVAVNNFDNGTDMLKQHNEVATTHSEEPFGLYKILNKKLPVTETSGPSPSLTHPPGFSPPGSAAVNQTVQDLREVANNTVEEDSPLISSNVMHTSQHIQEDYSGNSVGIGKDKNGGSVLGVLEEVIRIGRAMGYDMNGCEKDVENIIGNQGDEFTFKHKINFIAIQETKMERVSQMDIKYMWGKSNFDYTCCDSLGASGGILCIWEESVFKKDNVLISNNFVAIYRTWIPNISKILLVAIYAPQQPLYRRFLWEYLSILLSRWSGDAIFMGDFNEVRSSDERRGSWFNTANARIFNNFISSASLVDVKMEGYSFTWSHPSASKMSKLDRFLVTGGIVSLFPSITAVCLDRHLSDHRPILLCEVNLDFGPTPFRFYHSWFNYDGFDAMVEQTWRSISLTDSNRMIRFKKKLQILKQFIRGWIKDKKSKSSSSRCLIEEELCNINKQLGKDRATDQILHRHHDLVCQLKDIDHMIALDSIQKFKVSWAIEGDENSKFFHGIINKKRSHLAVREVFEEGSWITDPTLVKKAFRVYFESRFQKPSTSGLKLNFEFPNRLSSVLATDLERDVSHDEIKSAVWDCGENKSPGPDEFTFEFFRKYWKCIGPIFVVRLTIFSLTGHSPKMHKKALFLKVDFAKAYDSVRWDFLIDVLKAFGFGSKWCKWIRGTFCFAKASVLVNGSPSDEFQFHGGLKQGDPLSLFLFILVMESLHLSINRAINDGLFKGIRLNDDISLSHLFYADDAMFVGEWSDANLRGEGMSRHEAWEDVVVNLRKRLSKWKAKTLSIGGRFTLLKSVLGSSPLYTMSIFKVPKGVLKEMESIRSIFFKGVDKSENKISWVAWDKILASKKKGGLGVSSYYALNRALLLKWVWRKFKCLSSVVLISYLIALKGWETVSTPCSGSIQLSDLSSLLASVLLASIPDRWVFSLASDGSFRVKDVRNAIDDLTLSSSSDVTRSNLIRKGVAIESGLCPLCSSDEETTSHILFRCSLAKVILSRICRWWNFDWQSWSSFTEWHSWLHSIRLPIKVKSLLEGVFFVAWWSIWGLRNHIIFDANPPVRDSLFDDIVSLSFHWCYYRSRKVFSWIDCSTFVEDDSLVEEAVAPVKAKKVSKRHQKSVMTKNKESAKSWTTAKEVTLCQALWTCGKTHYLHTYVVVDIVFDRVNHVDITSFVDSDYTKDPDKEAGYMAFTEALKEAIWLRGHLEEEVLEAKTVKVLKVCTEHNVADAMTNAVLGLKLQHCLELLKVDPIVMEKARSNRYMSDLKTSKISLQSKFDQTSKISKSVFISIFPDDCTSRDLWKVCKDYGTVVDVFIPNKKSKAGKRFAFVRFIKA
nr:RNA-directed DNA polymerase, eukaryota [Tanacetum cinerariifolium]